MEEVQSLEQKIDAEFAASKSRLEAFQKKQADSYLEREKRLDDFGKTCEELRKIWAPRIEALAKRFGDKAAVRPTITPAHREVELQFQSDLAKVSLKLSVAPDSEVQNLVLGYDLQIVPSLMEYERHAAATLPLSKIDRDKIVKWVDDRILTFVKTYLALHENEFYLKRHMVVDPIAGVRFPKQAAAATLEDKGTTHYFISNETLTEFRKKQGAKG